MKYKVADLREATEWGKRRCIDRHHRLIEKYNEEVRASKEEWRTHYAEDWIASLNAIALRLQSTGEVVTSNDLRSREYYTGNSYLPPTWPGPGNRITSSPRPLSEYAELKIFDKVLALLELIDDIEISDSALTKAGFGQGDMSTLLTALGNCRREKESEEARRNKITQTVGAAG